MNRLDERIGGAGHGIDHQFMVGRMRLVVSASSRARGYVYIDEPGCAALLAAEGEVTGQKLPISPAATSSKNWFHHDANVSGGEPL
jgi:hypothetical protein